jgi:hypothetical protein
LLTGLDGLLQCSDSRRLETEIRLEVLGDLTDQSLERKFADQQLGGFLVSSNLTESDGSWLVSVGLLDTTSRWRGFASGLGSKLLSGCLATSGLAY